ncbi:ankyrin repeat protein, putative [Trichomonas vaginalis G3]|uniref:Ankyrin repeat protein, putative n=1 Tax=Trichomonas vaginalis (strain ATCC PRA-98 / G3) TaxID=412133 RepID=A2DTB1_TRIV3|nr:ankyrin repeat and SOCS box-containing protein 4 family [Trichomonas vaginalis G3]EAY16383.1 ankyrin repeat protein, putative [Trichomonas vaginalis G3]KAI5488389.1 ankyrin repeat and SOCS box-containing protein 4 family [Trichomonas vaginalis G3]|eukprot:XP_001328606.1 ankyrin repeat protein [Trichomonas vaginalis G3]
MTEKNIHPNKYCELRSIYKYYIDSYFALYQLKTEKEEELSSIYKIIKTELIESKKYTPKKIAEDILNIIPYNNRYTKSYLYLTKLISDDYQVELHDEYGYGDEFEYIFTENTIYKAIMYNNLIVFILFTEIDEFDKNQKLESDLYPHSKEGYSLLELCCYHGAVDCFKLLRTKFNSEITEKCLQFSFLGGNPEIMSECLKYQTPNEKCMKYAIISHNIDFVTFLMNEYNIEIDLYYCEKFKNLESFFVYFDQTSDVNKCLINSVIFNIQSLCEYFLSHGANINEKDNGGLTALHIAVDSNQLEIVEFLLSHGANIDEKDNDGLTALHIAVKSNQLKIVEFLLSHGANINEKDYLGKTALHIAVKSNQLKIVEFLLSHGANIDEKNNDGLTALHFAVLYNDKETVEFLLSHGANIDEKDYLGKTALHIAEMFNNEEIVKFLLSHGANIDEKDNDGLTALHIAVKSNQLKIVEFLLSHGANINEKDYLGKTALHIAVKSNQLKIVEFLLSHGANINEKDYLGKTALHIATKINNEETVEVLISNGAKNRTYFFSYIKEKIHSFLSTLYVLIFKMHK